MLMHLRNQNTTYMLLAFLLILAKRPLAKLVKVVSSMGHPHMALIIRLLCIYR